MDSQEIKIISAQENPTQEELLAIATALDLYFKGDYVNREIPFTHTQPTNWNSKIFGINQLSK